MSAKKPRLEEDGLVVVPTDHLETFVVTVRRRNYEYLRKYRRANGTEGSFTQHCDNTKITIPTAITNHLQLRDGEQIVVAILRRPGDYVS